MEDLKALKPQLDAHVKNVTALQKEMATEVASKDPTVKHVVLARTVRTVLFGPRGF